MTRENTQKSNGKTFRAHVWSPLNKGEAVLEIPVGATVEQLLNTLADIWGAQFKPDRGFANYHGLIAGWCLLCRSKNGLYCPLGINDEIPTSPINDDGEHPFHDCRGWFWETMDRARRSPDKSGMSFVTLEIIKGAYRNMFERGHGRRGLPSGVMETGPEGIPFDEDFKVLASGPEPKEPVDVRLALVIAVSGTQEMIKVVCEKHEDGLISLNVVRESIERSRDRLRVLANMVLSTSGVLLSVCFAFLVLLLERFSGSSAGVFLRVTLALSAFFFLLAAIFSIVSSLLHARFTILTEFKFINDLLKLIRREVKLFTFAFFFMVVGLIGVFLSILVAAITL